jgi:hypothetical protein
LLEQIMSTPIDECLYHRLYSRCLEHFPRSMTSVPWQTYPEHVPCPLPATYELGYQWGDGVKKRAAAARQAAVVARASQLMTVRPFPAEWISRRWLRIASIVHQFGVRDMEYVVRSTETFMRYWNHRGRA